jgi:hypothetical protein
MIAAEKAVEKILALATPTTTTSSASGSATAVPQYSQCGGIVSFSLPLFVLDVVCVFVMLTVGD